MWLKSSTITGAQLGALAEVVTQLAANEAAVRVPGSALSGISAWSAAERGFVDVPLVDGPALLRLLTQAEIVAATTNAATVPVVLQWLLLLAGGQPQRTNSALHIAGAGALLAAGVLTAPRHAQFLAGQPPAA